MCYNRSVDTELAYQQVRSALDAGRLAHGYIIVGAVRGAALELANRILKDLFPSHVEDRANPDIHWLSPEKKTRVIAVEAMRTKLIEPMEKTSFAGGWKAGVILGADCMRKESANAFLKTLEEPTPKTLFLLLTESPDQLLPTIVSRCQRIDLDDSRRRGLVDPWLSRTIAVLASKNLAGTTARAAAGCRLAEMLAEMKEKAEQLVSDELAGEEDGPGAETTESEMDALVASRYREMRADFLHTVMDWFRDLMAIVSAGPDAPLVHEKFRAVLCERAARLTRAAAFRNVEAVEEMSVSLERSLSEAAVLPFFADRVSFGVEGA